MMLCDTGLSNEEYHGDEIKVSRSPEESQSQQPLCCWRPRLGGKEAKNGSYWLNAHESPTCKLFQKAKRRLTPRRSSLRFRSQFVLPPLLLLLPLSPDRG
ncbi:hypothetical protein D9C73_021101 [Collichthys lucidus]|uniref:Uncharacterized protein n=1 Tax=Collichthys lucidus TaxID=240159 RepID=A0A4U5VFV0_COLLU|nr:hypothetical protein D9C73_021101 [Collichthys lucidus]